MKFMCGSVGVWMCGWLAASLLLPGWCETSLSERPEQALKLEAKGDYKGALQVWQSLGDETKDKSAKQVALGHVALLQFLTAMTGPRLNPTSEALAEIVNDNNYPAPTVKALALWYAASSSLKEKKPTEAKQRLDLLQAQFMDTVNKTPVLGWILGFLPLLLKQTAGQFADAGEMTTAHEMYAHLLKDYPDSKDRTVFQARLKQLEAKVAEKTEEIQRLRMEKNDPEATSKCQELIEKYPWSESAPWAAKTVGLIQAAQKNYAGAVQTLQKVVTDYPDKPVAAESLLQIGVFYQGPLKDLEVAVKTYDKVIEKYPKEEAAAVALFQRGVILQKIGDAEAAKQSWQRLIELFPTHPLAAIAKDKMSGQ